MQTKWVANYIKVKQLTCTVHFTEGKVVYCYYICTYVAAKKHVTIWL